jgi:mono/diheme cytochrome c family protein
MKRFVFAAFTLSLVFTFASFLETSAGKSNIAQDLFEGKCSLCHSADRPKSKKKTKKEWEATVMRMKNVNGAPLSDEEAGIIIEYLAENYGK